MSIILAIETSTERASVALLMGADLLTRESPSVPMHSEAVLPMVQDMLKEAGIALRECAAIAYGCGPGAFTGVRTACGLVQGLAFGAGLPVAPVVTLEAMAQACREQSGADEVMAVLDARMGEVYWARYRHEGVWRTVHEPSVSAPAAIDVAGTPVFCGNGLTLCAENDWAAAARAAQPPRWLPAIMPHASQIARLGLQALAQGRLLAARDAYPLYLRDKVALTTEERMAKAGA